MTLKRQALPNSGMQRTSNRWLPSRVGRRKLSAFVAQAVARELEREALGEFLDELDSALGAVPDAELKRVRREWPKR